MTVFRILAVLWIITLVFYGPYAYSFYRSQWKKHRKSTDPTFPPFKATFYDTPRTFTVPEDGIYQVSSKTIFRVYDAAPPYDWQKDGA